MRAIPPRPDKEEEDTVVKVLRFLVRRRALKGGDETGLVFIEQSRARTCSVAEILGDIQKTENIIEEHLSMTEYCAVIVLEN